MTDESVRWRLAAIFAADVVGHSRLMHADETRTRRYTALLRELIEPAIAGYDGRIARPWATVSCPSFERRR